MQGREAAPSCSILHFGAPKPQPNTYYLFTHLHHSYNYFDPDNYIATYALLQTGYPYLHEQVRNKTIHLSPSRRVPNAPNLQVHARRQVRLVLERSGDFINAKGQLPHHFVDDKPVFQALSGATQTGPNVFWILSCFNYVKHSGNMTWLQACVFRLLDIITAFTY